jgi:hypothetical protein
MSAASVSELLTLIESELKRILLSMLSQDSADDVFIGEIMVSYYRAITRIINILMNNVRAEIHKARIKLPMIEFEDRQFGIMTIERSIRAAIESAPNVSKYIQNVETSLCV